MLLHGMEVWVECEGKRLNEYSTKTEPSKDGDVISCFIPSEAGKKFTIHKKNGDADAYAKFETELDGVCTHFKVTGPGKVDTLWGLGVSPTTRRPIVFSNIKTTDADDFSPDTTHADLGTIKVTVKRVRKLGPDLYSRPPPPSNFHSVGIVHEKSKKSGAHCISLGEEVTVKRSSHRSCYLDLDQVPHAIFIFRYRPQGECLIFQVLDQAQEIIPSALEDRDPIDTSQLLRDQNPRKHARADEDEIDIKPEVAAEGDQSRELAEMKNQLMLLQRKIEVMEREKGSGPSKKAKKEEPLTETLPPADKEVIDLTLSD